MRTSINYFLFILTLTIITSCTKSSEYSHKLVYSNSRLFFDWQSVSYLKDLNWKEMLSKEDKDIILEIIDSSYNLVTKESVYEVLIPCLIHRFDISMERENLTLWEGDRNIFEITHNMSDLEFDSYLLSQINPDQLVKNLKNFITHYHYIGDDYLDVLVVRQCRRLRNWQIPSIELPNKLLNERQKYLIEFSRLESDNAIEELLNQAKFYNPEKNIYHGQISETLSSYGKIATLKSYSIFMDKKLLMDYSEFGKFIITNHLANKFSLDLNNEEILKLKDRVDSINLDLEKFGMAKHILISLKNLLIDKLKNN